MDSNMPILWQNALGQFTTEIGRKAWVWFAETRGGGMQYAADAYALEVEKLVLFYRAVQPTAQSVHGTSDEVMDDMLAFILARHANLRIGGNVRPTYIVEAR